MTVFVFMRRKVAVEKPTFPDRLERSMAQAKKKSTQGKKGSSKKKIIQKRKSTLSFSRKIPSFFSFLIPRHRLARMLLWSLVFLFLTMSGLGIAGPAGDWFNRIFLRIPFGYAWVLFPLTFILLLWKDFHQLVFGKREFFAFLATLLFGSGLLSLFTLTSNPYGGVVGTWIAKFFEGGFGIYFTAIFFAIAIVLSLILLFDPHLRTLRAMKEKVEEKIEEYHEEKEKEKKIEEAIMKSGEEMEDEKQEAPELEKGKKKRKKKDVTEENFDTSVPFISSYKIPPLSLLGTSSGKPSTGDIKANANLIQRTLMNFGIPVEMDEISIGPTVTRYAIKPAQGIRLSRIASLQNEIALALAAKSIRIEAPIPGRSLVGIEVPNKATASIGLGTLLSEQQFQESPLPLLVALGKGVSGESYFANIGKMPHMLIAGATGSGKSVTIHNFIISLLYRNGPEMLRFIMIDPKRVELTLYKKIPHLLTPVITDPKKAVLALKWAVREMERRYDVLQSYAVRDIDSYHKTVVAPAYKDLEAEEAESLTSELPEKMPYIVVIMDELSDIMSAYPRELEASIVRLAQMSRAVGIHLILATQRPSVNVITGLIKANIPTRIALRVTSQIDSRTILDTRGAEKLLGKGDMLYKGEGSNDPIRIQCPYVSEEEVKAVVSYIQKHTRFALDDEIVIPDEEVEGGNGFETSEEGGDDPLYEEARAIVVSAQKASTSYLQRRLSIGYSRAARIMDLLEERGVIGPARGSKPREVYEKPAQSVEEPEEVLN